MGIMYSNTPPENGQQNSNLFYGYADAAYANTDDYKSMSGYVFVVVVGAITWRSKKQMTMTITLSSTEAEYVALSIKGDNNGSIAMAHKPSIP